MTLHPSRRTAPARMKRRASPLVLAKPARVMRSTIQTSPSLDNSHLGNFLRHLAANDGVEGPLGLGCSVLAAEHPDDGAGELALLLDRLGVGHRTVEQERVVVRHQVVGDVHDLPEHLVWWIRDADVVPQGLAHLHLAVGADEERGGEYALGSLAIVLHHVAAHEQVVELIRATELHVGVSATES